jgi:hypothetical protein
MWTFRPTERLMGVEGEGELDVEVGDAGESDMMAF